MSAPLVSFTLVLKQYQLSNRFAVFQINIINQDYHKQQTITDLFSSMSAMSYLEYVSDLMANEEFKNKESVYKLESNRVAINLREKYANNIKMYVGKILQEFKESIPVLLTRLNNFIENNECSFDNIFKVLVDKDLDEHADDVTVKRQNLMIDKMKDLVKNSIWVCFGRPNIDEFGARYIEELS